MASSLLRQVHVERVDFLGAGVAGEESRVVGTIGAPGPNSDENVRKPFKLKRISGREAPTSATEN